MAFTDPPRTWTDGELVTASIGNTHWRDQFSALKTRTLIVGFGDVAGPTLTTGTKGNFYVPTDLTITGWSVAGDTSSGSIVIDVRRATFPSIPTSSQSIAGTEKPTITGAQAAQDLSLSTWTTSVVNGSHLQFVVQSITTFKQVSLTLIATQA